jgi:hypothetical protein
LWVRIVAPPIDAFGTTPTTLHLSGDAAATWTELAATHGSMFGFALSPDGARLAYGGSDEGVLIGPPDGSSSFQQVSAIQNRGLTWSSGGLYASATEPPDPFAVGVSTDMGRTFEAIYDLRNTCPQACPDASGFERVCRGPWSDPSSGVAALTGATGETCSVAWAEVSPRGDASTDAPARAIDAGLHASSVESSGGCSCRTMPSRHAPAKADHGAMFLAGVTAWILGARRRARCVCPSGVAHAAP